MAVDLTAVVVVIGGAIVTPFARVGRIRIDDVLNDAPNTAALTVVFEQRYGAPETAPFAPPAFDAGAFATLDNRAPILKPPPVQPGAPIQIYSGAPSPESQIFGGQIVTRDQYAELDVPKHVRFDLSCIDYTRRLNRRKVVKEYGQQSASAIVLDLVATYAPGITTANVVPALATVTGGITFTFEEPSRALSRIAEKIGGYWYIDYQGDLHFFVDPEPFDEPDPLVPGADFADFRLSADLTQVRTRVLVEGDGATALATLAAGDAATPISQSLPFNPSGGLAKIGPNLVAYAGVQAGGAQANTLASSSGGTPPPAAPGAPFVAVASATTQGALSGGPYQYAVTLETADGARSDIGAASIPVTISPAANPPTTHAAVFASPGPIRVGVTSIYSTSYVDAQGNETVATPGGTPVTGSPVANPSSWITGGTGESGGGMEPGFYSYAYTFLTAAGESAPGYMQSAAWVQAPASAVRMGIPTSTDPRVVGRRVYRSSVNTANSTTKPPWRHVADIPDNATTNFLDTSADAWLATRNLPAASTANDPVAAQVYPPTSSDPRVVARRIYRKDDGGDYRFVVQIPDNFTTAYNDVTVGPGGGLAPNVNRITTGAINLSSIPLGPAGTVRRRLFRTTAGGAEYREVAAIPNNTSTLYTDVTPDSNLGGSPLPSQGGAGTGAAPTPEHSTTIQVDTLTGFPSSGWVAVESQMIRYTGTSTTGGLFLVGIPSSGPGAIDAAIPAGTVVTASPALVGVSPVVPVTLGDAVQLIAQVDDVPAQQAIASLEGGDGIIEHYIQDRRLSESGARARGLAELALFKQIESRLSYTTHDPKTRSGRTIHVDLPAPTNVTGDFLVQRVVIDDVSFAKNVEPKRQVEASTTRFSFDDVLNRLLMEQA